MKEDKMGGTYSTHGEMINSYKSLFENLKGRLFERTRHVQNGKSVGFEVLTAVSVKMAVFWVVAPCSRPDDGDSKDL
jgi:hypothetical protein